MKYRPELAPQDVAQPDLSQAPTAEQIELMLRITANAVAHGETHLFPLLKRLEKDHAIAKKEDPVAHAKQLLANLNR